MLEGATFRFRGRGSERMTCASGCLFRASRRMTSTSAQTCDGRCARPVAGRGWRAVGTRGGCGTVRAGSTRLPTIAPECKGGPRTALGMHGFWMGYCARLRAAPRWVRSGPEVATALFYGFHTTGRGRAFPERVGTMPSVGRVVGGPGWPGWMRTLRQVDGATRWTPRRWPKRRSWPGPPAQAADKTAGRVLAAANQALPRCSEPQAPQSASVAGHHGLLREATVCVPRDCLTTRWRVAVWLAAVQNLTGTWGKHVL